MQIFGLVKCSVFIGGAIIWISTRVEAQCLGWSPGFELDQMDGSASCLGVFDDGTGPALVAGGSFGPSAAYNSDGIRKWDDGNWAAVGSGLPLVYVTALSVFDDGSGTKLYAGGQTGNSGGSRHGVWRLDTDHWTRLAELGDFQFTTLITFDDGAGLRLYASGNFPTQPGGYIAKWNGTTWSSVGTQSDQLNSTVAAMTVLDVGSGAALYVAGEFSATYGGAALSRIAKWDGLTWSPLGSGIGATSRVRVMASFDDGSGAALYVGGQVTSAGGLAANNIAKWNGTSWDTLGSGTNGAVSALTVFDDGSGPALYVGGTFTTAGGLNASNIAKWNGNAWSTVANGVNGGVTALAVFDDGSGAPPRLCVSGPFESVVATTPSSTMQPPFFTTWNGSSWESFTTHHRGLAQVTAMAAVEHTLGSTLYVASYSTANYGRASVAKWDGAHWRALGSGFQSAGSSLGTVYALMERDEGTGPVLYAGGSFATAGGTSAGGIARWDGSNWSPLASGGTSGGTTESVHALAYFDDSNGPAIYAAGRFSSIGGVAAVNIAKWDGVSWTSIGGTSSFSEVEALAVFDDGTGAALYAGGYFATMGGVSVKHIARWNGSSWSALGTGMSYYVFALCVFDDGSGPALYAGGHFTTAGGVNAHGIAKWDGHNWSDVGSSTAGSIANLYGLSVHDDGTGAALYAVGYFNAPSATTVNGIAKWNGTQWTTLSGGIPNLGATKLASFDDGSGFGHELYVGGQFTIVDGRESSNIARWGLCRPGSPYCFGDGIDPMITAQCPCGNVGNSGHGCANSDPTLGGAFLTGSGATNPNTVLLTCTGIPNDSVCTFLRASAGAGITDARIFGDGIGCFAGAAIRFGSQQAGHNGHRLNTVSSACATVPPGKTRYYQLHYRDLNASFCTSLQFNMSNGYVIEW